MRHLFYGIILSTLLAACTGTTAPDKVGFYHWRGAWSINAYEDKILRESGADKLYLRLFDVDLTAGNKVLPVGKLLVRQKLPTSLELVPVIYITQAALRASANMDTLASNIIGLAADILALHSVSAKELQLDCDWTQSSRSQYFELLAAVRRQPWMQGRALSCTIRLHQIKYKLKTGVPPVDRGMLMCYNMGSMLQPGGHNSIIEWPQMRSYLTDIGSYSLPLDVVLPIYSWILLFDGTRFKGIIYGSEAILSQPQVKALGAHNFEVMEDFDFRHYRFRKGQTLRNEAANMKTVAPLWQYIRQHHKSEDYTLSLYHLDSASIANFGRKEVLQLMHK